MNKETILLTGGLGKIGWLLGKRLAQLGYRILIFDKAPASHRHIREGISHGLSPLDIIQGDMLDKEALRKVFSRHDIAYVIHLAALTSVSQSLEAPLSYFETNVGGSLTLLDVMTEYQVFNLIFASSAAIFASSLSPLREDAPLKPLTPYATSKLMVETVLAAVAKANANWTIVSLRFFNPVFFGDRGEGMPTSQAFVHVLQEVLRREREVLPLYGLDYETPDGSVVRDFFHSDDLVAAHCRLLEKFPSQAGFYPYNIGSGRGSSLLEVVTGLEARLGRRLPVAYEARRQGDLAASVADISRFSATFDWSPRYDLSDLVGQLADSLD